MKLLDRLLGRSVMSKRKRHTTITIDMDIINWIKEQIEKKRFSSISHGLEWCVYQIMEKEKEET